MTTATHERITHERITHEQFLSEQDAVRRNIVRRINQLTNNGAALVDGYMAFVNGEYPDAKPYLVQNAIRDLSLMGEKIPQDATGSPVRVVRQEDMPKRKKPKLTMKEICVKFVGDFIRRETDNCLDLISEFAEFLNPPYVFKSANPDERKVQKALAFKPHHRFAAMNELGKRTVGGINPYPTYPLTSAWEDRILRSQFGQAGNRFLNDGIAYARHLLDVVKNDDYLNAKGEIIDLPYTQTQRLKALKILLYYGVDVPWEHITYDAIDAYLRDLYDSERANAERRIAESKAAAHAELAPDQEASVLEMFEQMQSATDESDAKAAKVAAKKAAKKEAAAKSAALTGNNAANRKSNGNAADSASKRNANGKNSASGNADANRKNAVDTHNTSKRNAKNAVNANGNSPANAKDAADNTSKRNANAKSAVNAKNTGPGNGKNAANNGGSAHAGDTDDSPDAPTDTGATPPADRGATAVANLNSPDNAKDADPGNDKNSAAADNTGKNTGNANATDKNAGATAHNTSKHNGNAADTGKNAAKDTGDARARASAAKDAIPGNGNSAANGNNAGDTADAPADRGATAVANARARHPEVDLDTALENFPETVGVPKEALTHDLIYRAVIAEANYQKRQQKFKNLPSYDAPDFPKADDPPNTRSP